MHLFRRLYRNKNDLSIFYMHIIIILNVFSLYKFCVYVFNIQQKKTKRLDLKFDILKTATIN